MCKYQDIISCHSLQGRCNVQNLAHLHMKDFAFLHIKNVKVPNHSVCHPSKFKVKSGGSWAFACAKCKIMHICMCKILHSCTSKKCKELVILFSPSTSKMQSAQSCKFTHVQDFTFLHINMFKYQVILFFHSYIQDAKCNIFHIGTWKILHYFKKKCASTKIFNPLNARCNV